MKAEKIGVILMETFYNRADAEAVAAKTGAKVVEVASGTSSFTSPLG